MRTWLKMVGKTSVEHANRRIHRNDVCKVPDYERLKAPKKLISLVGLHWSNSLPLCFLLRQILHLSPISEDLPGTKNKRVDVLEPICGDLRQRPVLDWDFSGADRRLHSEEKVLGHPATRPLR